MAAEGRVTHRRRSTDVLLPAAAELDAIDVLYHALPLAGPGSKVPPELTARMGAIAVLSRAFVNRADQGMQVVWM